MVGRADVLLSAPGPRSAPSPRVLIGDAIRPFSRHRLQVTGAPTTLGQFVQLDSAPAELSRTRHGAASLSNGDITSPAAAPGQPARLGDRYQVRGREF